MADQSNPNNASAAANGDAHSSSNGNSIQCTTITIYLIRHGDRYDYANKDLWQRRSTDLGLTLRDPPLSALGHKQARETAKWFEDNKIKIDNILVSPYLRVLQTAQPLSHLQGKPMCVEYGLAETPHHKATIQEGDEYYRDRVQAFPEIDEAYESVFPKEELVFSTENGKSEPIVEYFRRMRKFAKSLVKDLLQEPQQQSGVKQSNSVSTGKTLALFSHAASIAFVAALTNCPSLLEEEDSLKFAPCGIWKLVSDGDSAAWRIEKTGASNNGHVSENHPGTFPWGWCDHPCGPEKVEREWKGSME